MTARPIVEVFRLIRDGNADAAISLLQQIRNKNSESQLAKYLLEYMAIRPKQAVYDEPRAFQAFVDGGGNIQLYSDVISSLKGLISPGAKSLLDIGCGDGRVTARISRGLQEVEIVEPSLPLFQAALSILGDQQISTLGNHSTIQAFLKAISVERRWDMATMTFSLQCVAPPERNLVLSGLRKHVGKLVVVEFDVCTCTTELDRFESLIARYEHGISEYLVERELVAMGFLMPMLFSQIRPRTSNRINWEQPKEKWIEEFESAGYSNVSFQKVSDYWWSDCFAFIAC